VTQAITPSLGRRLLCVLYDGLLVSALLLVATFPFVALTQGLDPSLARHLLQAYLLLVTGAYFTLFWRKGQTLAMKTWKLRLESTTGGHPSWGQAWMRYLLACASLALLGLGWWGALFRADGQFLQDRLAGTRLVRTW
jgi:uncharacterized RDD family membrane protein YckC